MHQYQERAVDRKTDGKTLCKGDMGSVLLREEDVLVRKKWNNDIHKHSGDPRS